MTDIAPVQDFEYSWKQGEGDYGVCDGTILTEHDIVEFRAKVPNDGTDQRGVLVFPGFSDGIYGTDRLTNAFAELDYPAVTLNYSRTENPEFEGDPEAHKVFCGMLALWGYRMATEDEKPVFALGHSEGGSNATRAATEYSDEFIALLLKASGGLIEDDDQNKILIRALSNPRVFLSKTGHAITHPGFSWRMLRGATDYVIKNPVKAQREAARIASADIRDRIPVLIHELGIPTGALQSDRDEMFPLKLVRRDTDNGRIFDIFKTMRGDHLAVQKHPRQVALMSTRILERLVEIQHARDLRAAALAARQQPVPVAIAGA